MAEPVRSSAEWVAYFQANAANLKEVPWHAGAGVTAEEIDRIAESLRAWQLGETSDGRHLLRAAENYAAEVGDPEFLDAVRLFILEEQRHGAELGRSSTSPKCREQPGTGATPSSGLSATACREWKSGPRWWSWSRRTRCSTTRQFAERPAPRCCGGFASRSCTMKCRTSASKASVWRSCIAIDRELCSASRWRFTARYSPGSRWLCGWRIVELCGRADSRSEDSGERPGRR